MGTLLKIVILEPCRDTLDSMAALIEIWGHEARGTDTARKAIQLFRDFRPDVMFVNVDTKGMNCLDFVREICVESDSRPPVLTAISSYGESLQRPSAVRMGFDCQLTKPVDPGFLKDILTLYARTLDREAKWAEIVKEESTDVPLKL